MPRNQPEHLHPDLRPAFQALAEVRNFPARTRPQVGNRNPAQVAYQRLVDELAANVGDEGWYDVKQVRPLSNAERAATIRANPDVLNDFPLDAEQIALIFEG